MSAGCAASGAGRGVDQERFVLTKIIIVGWLVALVAILWLLWRSKKVF